MLLSLNAAAGAAIGISFGHERLQVAVADLSSTVLAERSAEFDVDHEPVAAVSVKSIRGLDERVIVVLRSRVRGLVCPVVRKDSTP
jgi:predicted NBD/HSP70 family sugar kinase